MRHAMIMMIFITCAIMGCSGNSPTLPNQGSTQSDSLPIIGFAESGGVSNALGLLGAYELIMDPETVSAELTAKRTSAIGESFIVSGKGFFTITPCSDCFKIKRISLDSDGNVVLTFHLKHPFEPGNDAKPPTARNRKDLDIFDTACIVVPKETTPTTYSLLGESIYSGICVNPDGYTKELANVFSPMDNTVMPYFLAIDNSTDQTPPVSTYNEFSMGASTEFDMVFNLSSPLKFDLYLTFGYGAAARKSTFMSPKYYNPEFNRKAAWKVSVIPPTEPWVEGENAPSDTRIVTVEIYDWQTGADVSAQENYEDETDTTKVYAASEVSEVELEVLGVKQSVTTPSGTHTGMPGDPLIFEIPVANSAPSPSPAGEYTGIVKVSDSRPVATSISEGRDFLIDTPNGIVLNNVLMPEFATYQTFTAVVTEESGCGPIIFNPATDMTGCPTGTVSNGESFDFTVTATSDGASQITYEIDSDYDGSAFNPDGPANTDGVFNGLIFLSTPCTVGDTFTVAFRFTDNCDPVNVLVVEACTVEIGECCPVDTGDLKVLSINRNNPTYVGQITSLTFDWNDHPCAEEYVFQRADGYTGTGWTDVATTTSSTYDFVPVGNDPDDDIRFRVIAREVAGNPSTNFLPSEEVFVLMVCNGGGTTNNYWQIHFNNSDGRFAFWGNSNGIGIDGWPDPANSGIYKNWIGIYGHSPANAWSVARNPTAIPDIVGQTECFGEGYWTRRNNWISTMGLVIGTLSNPLPPADPTLCDFEPSNDVYNGAWPFDRTGTGINEMFCETGMNSWYVPGNPSGDTWYRCGAYLNDLLDPGRDYVAFGFANGALTDGAWTYGISDAWVFVVH
jgi:hypothetical protein